MTAENRDRLFLVLLTSLLLLPFVRRPVFFDDHAHIDVALDLIQHPSTPFLRNGAGLGWKQGEDPLNANPLLFFYLVGFFMKIAGTALWKSHLFLLPFHALSILSFHEIAKRYVRHPVWASVLWLTTPHFWLTGNSLLLDGLITPFLLPGLYFWMKGWESNHTKKLILGGFLIGLSALVKYTAALGVGFAFLWSWFEGGDRRTKKWLAGLVPVFMFGGWLGWTRLLYRESHFAAVAHASMVLPDSFHFLLLLIFLTGTSTCLILGPAALLSLSWRRRLMGLLIFAAALAVGRWSGLPTGVGLQMGCWLGLSLMWIAALGASGNILGTARGKFLLSWTALGLAGLAVARGWFCARYFVIVGPALVLLTVMLVEDVKPGWTNARGFLWGTSVFFVITTGLLAVADYQQARIDEKAAGELNAWAQQDGTARKHYYPSALLTGLEYYLDKSLWTEALPGQEIEKGGAVVLPWRSLPTRFHPHVENPMGLKQWIYEVSIPLRTVDSRSFAGFYGSVWGPLPFSFSRAPAEAYTLLEAR